MPERDAEIVVRDELVAVTHEAIAALLGHRAGVYVRGRLLVHLGQSDGLEDPATRLVRPAGAPVIVPLTAAALRGRLDEAARWVKEVGRGKRRSREPALPPTWVAEQILARTAWPFRPLEGVVATPVLRPDGSVLDTPGYDRATGLFYEPVGASPAIPGEPSVEDARRALAALHAPVREFPFCHAASRAAYVAAVLSLVGRYAIGGPVPAFSISSPSAGEGKGLLAHTISTIGTGRPAALMGPVREDDELRKRILAIALAGTPLVLLDNVSGVLGSDVLAAALTARTWSDRMLGVSTVVEAPLRTVWIFTGRNLSFRRTLGRRIIPIFLDAGVEHPEDRTFEVDDLPGHVRTERSRLVAAALTILRAYALAGRPRHPAPRMGSFEEWDGWVRGACLWLGLADPAATDDPQAARGRLRASADEDREGLGGMLEALSTTFGERPFTAAAVAERAKTEGPLHQALEEAGATNRGGQITARATGYRFRDAEGRVVDGLRLVTDDSERHAKVRLWRVAQHDGRRAGDAGNAGDETGPSAARTHTHDVQKEIGLETSPAPPASPAAIEGRYGL